VPFQDGYPTVDDCYNTSHDFAVACTFPSGTEMVFTSRGDNGILFEGSKRRIFVNREDHRRRAGSGARRPHAAGGLRDPAGLINSPLMALSRPLSGR
jgi:hypothetical protein